MSFVERSFNQWLESLIYYGGWGAREATYIQFLSAQTWTPSLSTFFLFFPSIGSWNTIWKDDPCTRKLLIIDFPIPLQPSWSF
jgi:hypothetical protein